MNSTCNLPYAPTDYIAHLPAWTYAEFEQRGLEISFALQQQKISAIAIWLEDVASLACTLLGAWHAGTKVLFPPNGTPESLTWANQTAQLWIVDKPIAVENAVQFDDFACQNAAHHLPPIPPFIDRHNQTEIWLKTSGSSGDAKTIIKTAQEMWLSADVLAQALPFAKGNQITALSTVSGQHIYGLTVQIMMALVQGWAIGRKQLFFPECIANESRQLDNVVLISSPAMLSRIDWQQTQFTHLRGVISSGGALASEHSELIRQQTSQPVVEIYGSTETGPIAIRQDIGLWQTLPFSQIGTDENGALWLEAAWAKDRQQTADAVEIHPNGFELLGRIDRIVKIGDKRTSLVSVEQSLNQHHWINDCYITKHPDEPRLAVWAELSDSGITAFRDNGRKALIVTLKQHLAQNQEKTAIPRFWRLTDKLPRNSQSKISRLDFEQICREQLLDAIWLSETQQENGQISQAKVPLDLHYFKGHFANFPLVPGVVELQWVMEKITAYFGREMPIVRIDNLKFQKFLRPNDEFELTLKWDESKNRMGFQLKTDNEMCASGLVIFQNG
ncbi:AMP-binding protein [[Haemophilus] felis]|uniref:AMP-binding protein n=1 Tax=[Haemophilus] felis TaxID=123822 RepID=A0A1T0B091_9PAST|nr:AMP-binding protein [[Haemophilus] felis]NBI40121.1 AMP-binding protein [[Haemophilus] felis]OOS03494.1 AMP-binding protein [[Haemophilus] felis]